MVEKKEQNITSEKFLARLKKGLQVDGDFPACAKFVNEIRALAGSQTSSSSKIAETVLKDPAVSTKILSFVNSAFFQRGAPITTISQAIVHLGTNQIAELCSNFTLIQKFVPTARKGGPFAIALERLIVASILTSSINAKNCPKNHLSSKSDETSYLLGTFSELGLMLTSYYYPKLFENAYNRSKEKKISLDNSIKQLTGFDPLEISLEVLKALGLHGEYYSQIRMALDVKNNKIDLKSACSESKSLLAAKEIANNIIDDNNEKSLDNVINDISEKYTISKNLLNTLLTSFTKEFSEHCDALQVVLPEIPLLASLKKEEINNKKLNIKDVDNNCSEDSSRSFALASKYLNDIQEATKNGESVASIITTALEALLWGLNFERVFLLLVDQKRTKIKGRMGLGMNEIIPESISFPIDDKSQKIPVKCLLTGKIITSGEMILPNDSSCIAIPVGNKKICIGVIYASITDTNYLTSPFAISCAEVIQKCLENVTSI